ncbi:MAG: integrase core domain-containing protein [Alphaproteobacteria bacterium]|nr:integrase core domain-containing protein [Alphaproteobacteria bacterium]MCZ6495018.1 integrase core domain-containing protein [Alphaproteobacteria bacterium]
MTTIFDTMSAPTIEPGKPVQNAIVESFNGKFRGDV